MMLLADAKKMVEEGLKALRKPPLTLMGLFI